MGDYNSSPDTLSHIREVGYLVAKVCRALVIRAVTHDQSKLLPPEKEAFDQITPRLRGTTYGSEQYRATLQEMRPAIEHHQTNNRHHPEYHKDGISGMTLIDLIEMLCDWKAATLRHDDGDLRRSLALNAERFGISEQLLSILSETAEYMGWCDPPPDGDRPARRE